MNKKIALSAGMILFVAAGALGMTGAFFSDTETSTGNTFTAGAIDLKIDSVAHVNGLVCFDGKWHPESVVVWNGTTLVLAQGQTPESVAATVLAYNTANPAAQPQAGDDCGTTWGQPNGKDIVGEKFFNFTDIKPGDEGENTISIHVDNNDAWMCATVGNLVDDENSITEPEGAVDNTPNVGELSSKLLVTIWKDDGDNIQENGETVLVNNVPVSAGVFPLYTPGTTGTPFPGGQTKYLGVKWTLPSTVGNEVQTDKLTGDISFYVEQARNNPQFVCPQPEPVLR